MKLDFTIQPSSKSTLPFAGLQHIQQCQVNFHSVIAPGIYPNEWCLKNGLLSEVFNPRPLSHESSALTTRPWLLAIMGSLWDREKLIPLTNSSSKANELKLH
jgi:hypothetical protein